VEKYTVTYSGAKHCTHLITPHLALAATHSGSSCSRASSVWFQSPDATFTGLPKDKERDGARDSEGGGSRERDRDKEGGGYGGET
jgi:hypothetical protein